MATCPKCYGELKFIGDGKWECDICGKEYDEFEDDDIDFYGEAIDLHDAALIWLSHGKDSDYSFGYDEEELEDALR